MSPESSPHEPSGCRHSGLHQADRRLTSLTPWAANIRRRSPRSRNASLCSCRSAPACRYRHRCSRSPTRSCCRAAARTSRRSITARKRRSCPTRLDPVRDALTLPLIRAAVERKTPLFAICRGFQELNVALGGSLHQAVHDVDGHKDHRATPRHSARRDAMVPSTRFRFAANCAIGSAATRSWSTRCTGRASPASPMG